MYHPAHRWATQSNARKQKNQDRPKITKKHAAQCPFVVWCTSFSHQSGVRFHGEQRRPPSWFFVILPPLVVRPRYKSKTRSICAGASHLACAKQRFRPENNKPKRKEEKITPELRAQQCRKARDVRAWISFRKKSPTLLVVRVAAKRIQDLRRCSHDPL